jgi:pilus assembly protein Flp/PilA
MKSFVSRFLRENKAVTAIEYGLIAGVVAIAIATSATSVGSHLNDLFTTISNKIQNAATSAASS